MEGQGEVVLMRYFLKDDNDDDDAFFYGAFSGNNMMLTFSLFVKVCLFKENVALMPNIIKM